METTAKFSISTKGDVSQLPYSGNFTVKAVLTRREQFVADQRRREIVGSFADGAIPALHSEAFMLGQLFVRIQEAPKFWTDSDGGLDLQDYNVIKEIFDKAISLQDERIASLKKQADEAAKTLKADK